MHCPLCDSPYDESLKSKRKKFKEACGHEKCYLCLISSMEVGCTNCIAEAAGSSKESSTPDKKTNSDVTSSSSCGEPGSDKKDEDDKDDLEHINILEQNPPLFQCNICKKKFKTRCQIYYHRYCDGRDKPYKCEDCGKGFITSGNYKGHLRTHTGERPFHCPVCDRSFTDSSVMRRHARSHSGEKHHHCQICSSSFTTAQALKEHALTHTGERPLDCPHCNKSFHRRKILQQHILTHTGERPFTCSECEKTFARKWTYDLHLKTPQNNLFIVGSAPKSLARKETFGDTRFFIGTCVITLVSIVGQGSNGRTIWTDI